MSPRVELTKEFTFEAAHRLPNLPADHKCYRMHGHGFRVEIAVAGEIEVKLGWLVDYADIAADRRAPHTQRAGSSYTQ